MMRPLPFPIRFELPGWGLFWAELKRLSGGESALAELRIETARVVREERDLSSLAKDEVVAAMRKLFRQAGTDPTRYRPASEALLRRRRGCSFPDSGGAAIRRWSGSPALLRPRASPPSTFSRRPLDPCGPLGPAGRSPVTHGPLWGPLWRRRAMGAIASFSTTAQGAEAASLSGMSSSARSTSRLRLWLEA